MVIESLLNGIKSAIIFILDLLPDMPGASLPAGFINWFTDVFSLSAYFLPLGDFIVMLGIFLFVTNFEFFWKLIQRVWDALPFT